MRTTAQYFVLAKSSTTGSRRPLSFEIFTSVCGTCHTDSTGVGAALFSSLAQLAGLPTGQAMALSNG
jgi:mono/diheme cytochrome c family protein